MDFNPTSTNTNFNVYSDTTSVYKNAFVSRLHESFSARVNIEMVGTVPDLIAAVKTTVARPVARVVQHDEVMIEFEGVGGPLLASISLSARSPFQSKKRLAAVTLHGHIDAVEAAYLALETAYPQQNAAMVDWYFRNPKGEANSITVDLVHRDPPLDEFYPWIEDGIASYHQRFLADDANVLLLIGDPGTGKTTFIRDLIHRNNLATAITHDEGLMGMDEFFISFMTGTNELLVLEDADCLLYEREDGNRTMSKLLNTSDGLVKTKKKVILTANITHLERVDSALLRPGRCFDIMHFRALRTNEARLAAKAAGVPAPDEASTLADLFKGSRKVTERRTGFHTVAA